MATSEDYRGFTLTTADGWTVISGPDGNEFGKVRGVEEAQYWADTYVQQRGQPS